MAFPHPSKPLEPSEACPPARDRRKDRQIARGRQEIATGRSSPAGSGGRDWAGRRGGAALTSLPGRPGGFLSASLPPQARAFPGGGRRPRPGRACVHGQPRPAGHQPSAQLGTGPSWEVPGAAGSAGVTESPGSTVGTASGGKDWVCESLCRHGFLLCLMGDQSCVPLTL